MSSPPDVSANLAGSLIQLRDLRGWTQAALSKASGVPRATIATLESGSANPTLSVLMRLAAALRVTLDELVTPPRSGTRHYPADSLPHTQRGPVSVRQLLPDHIPGVTVERMAFPAGGRLVGTPHTPGTREYLTCESGCVQLSAGGETTRLEAGDVVVFRGDQRHGYQALDDEAAVAYAVVMPRPA